MTKSIETLVEDIDKLFDEGVEEVDDALLDDFTIRVRSLMASRLRNAGKQGPGTLRASNIGKPDRQIYYAVNNYPSPPLDATLKRRFLMGDLIEEIILFLAQVAGHEVKFRQAEQVIDGVKGHWDAVIDGWIVDVKSASPYAFRKFRDNAVAEDDPFGYIGQISFYSQAADNPKAAFLAMEKSSTEMALAPVDQEVFIDASERIAYLREMVKSPEPPERCYEAAPEGKSGNLSLPRGCSFCSYADECWKDANDGQGIRWFQYSNKVVGLVEVQREPNVEEIHD